MNKHMLHASLVILVGTGLLAGCQDSTHSKSTSQANAISVKPDSPVLAVVNGRPITQAELKVYQTERAGQLSHTQLSHKKLVQELIDMALLEQAAEKAGISKQPDIQAQIALNRDNTLIKALLRQKFGNKQFPEGELKKKYEQLIIKAGAQEYEARHILIKTQAQAKKIIQQLNHGTNFAKLAKKYSIAPSAPKGGELGWFAAQSMVPNFAKALEKLKKGEYTQTPVHTRFGWHIILLQNTRKLTPPPFSEVKPRLRALLVQQAIRKYVRQLSKGAKIKIKTPPA